MCEREAVDPERNGALCREHNPDDQDTGDDCSDPADEHPDYANWKESRRSRAVAKAKQNDRSKTNTDLGGFVGLDAVDGGWCCPACGDHVDDVVRAAALAGGTIDCCRERFDDAAAYDRLYTSLREDHGAPLPEYIPPIQAVEDADRARGATEALLETVEDPYYQIDEHWPVYEDAYGVDEFPGDVYTREFGDEFLQHARWLASCLSPAVEDTTDLLDYRRELWDDDYIADWL